MTNISGMKTSELLAIYNSLSGKPELLKWKKKVTDLVAAVLKMSTEHFYEAAAPSDRMDGFEAPQEELSAQGGRPVNADEETLALRMAGKPDPKPTKSKAKKAKKPAKAKKAGGIERGAIRQLCEEMLLKVKGTDEKTKRPLGLPYSEILSAVHKKFPDAATSLNCLRWYATKLNKQTGKEKVVMPTRPKTAVAA